MASGSGNVAGEPADFEVLKRPPPPQDAFRRLAPLGWKGGLLLIAALLIASFFLAGYFTVYWRNADMDLFVVYNAFLVNDGRPQLYFDHPAYFTIMLVRVWFQFLHHLGLLDAWKLSSVFSLDATAFNAAMTGSVRAARVLSLLITLVFVVAFAELVRRIVRDRHVAMLATLAFALSGALAMQMRILRTELIAASLVDFGFLILVIVARRAGNWRPLALALVACLCVLGLENKVHVILLIAALPMMILPFGSAGGASTSFWKNDPRRWFAVGGGAIVAMLMLWTSSSLIRVGFDPTAMAATTPSLKPLFGTPGVYQIGLLLWTGFAMAAFATLWKVSFAESLAGMLAVLAGACLALLALNVSYYSDNVVATLNPIERMLSFADMSGVSSGGGIFSVAGLFAADVGRVLLRYTFFLSSSPRPTVFLTWLVLPGIVYAWRRGERQTAAQAAVLMLCTLAIDSIGMRRGLKDEYFIFTDPLIIIAGAVLLDRLSDLRFNRWAYPIGVVLVVLHVAVGQAEPIKHVFARRGPEGICEWRPHYTPLLPLPWCSL
jgi:hypothetical protein